MPTCPNGHQSGSDDWCEVCGHRMAGPGAAAGAVPPPPPPPPAYGYPGPGGHAGPGADPQATAQAELCPQCRTPREAMAPFCEECRYNFLTQTATSYTPISPPPQPGLNLPPGFQAQPGPPPGPPRDPFDYQGSRPSQMNRPAEPLGHEPDRGPGPAQGGPGQPPNPLHGPGQAPNPLHGPGGPGPGGPGYGPGPGQAPGGQQPPQGFPPPVPSAFQQGGPPAPPAFPQPSPPAPPQHTGGGDDWMLSPPSRTQSPPPPPGPQAPPGHQGPQGPPSPQGPQSPSPFGQPPQQHQAPPQGGPQGQPPHFPAQPQQPLGWTAVIAPDRDYFMAMMQRSGPEATGLNLPAYSPEQRLPLSGNQVSIGRRRHSTGESPDIDLSVPPEDPGVSHQHAVLVQQPDGSWAVVDKNSTNGTTLNGAEDPIQPYVPIPLQDGDRVHVGAWTTITVRRG
ncbi:FHA domain-containing protein [Streptomyces genisteinicus]|uniref:FHA domain-containing protein n=1 Tax=Streptomyces genisteinicus TaxID=2768068 RepID=A0A7H0HS29_9ACTN|nr:FHA domain-containing protein [Streptomyces genisteinicus]QNP63345.1 FHA domain-containing protein [Streptomyces genisteinicus]